MLEGKRKNELVLKSKTEKFVNIRKFMTLGIVFAMVIIGWMTLLPAGAHTEDEPFVTDLIAGQHTDVGDVSVWNDGEFLYVKYSTTGNWYITETHLSVSSDFDGIPQTKKGNPKPGKFEYSTNHIPTVQEYIYTINLESQGFDVGDEIYIAAHAVVATSAKCTFIEETAWGEGPGFPGKNWAMYLTYTIQEPYKIWKLPECDINVKVKSPGTNNNYFDITLSGVGSNHDISDGVWTGWCADKNVFITPGKTYSMTAYSSYDTNLPTTAQDDEQWDKINYLLNNKHPSASMNDIQTAIWYFADSSYPYPSDPEARSMVDDANANGDGFRPGPGQWGAVILFLNSNTQLIFIEVDP